MSHWSRKYQCPCKILYLSRPLRTSSISLNWVKKKPVWAANTEMKRGKLDFTAPPKDEILKTSAVSPIERIS